MKQKHAWEITDAFWEKAEPLVPRKTRDQSKEYQRRPGGGRRAMEPRRVLEAIFYVLRTGIQWKALPKEFGAASAIHRYFPFWCEQGFFEALWVAGLHTYTEVTGINWTWLSADGCMSKAPLALETMVVRGFIPQIKGRREERTEKTHNSGYRARRWIVEVLHFGINRFRKLLVRFEKLKSSYLGLLMFACAFIAFRKADVI